ncbi:MAG: ATP-binding cassette domain-containing protein, partial [Pseudomonadota bacterium]
MNALVELRNVERVFQVRNNRSFFGMSRPLRAVQDVSFQIRAGETLGLVGESGCGKSTVGKLVLGLLAPSGGDVLFDGQTLSAAQGSTAWRERRRDMQLIFQNPFGALNP